MGWLSMITYTMNLKQLYQFTLFNLEFGSGTWQPPAVPPPPQPNPWETVWVEKRTFRQGHGDFFLAGNRNPPTPLASAYWNNPAEPSTPLLLFAFQHVQFVGVSLVSRSRTLDSEWVWFQSFVNRMHVHGILSGSESGITALSTGLRSRKPTGLRFRGVSLVS